MIHDVYVHHCSSMSLWLLYASWCGVSNGLCPQCVMCVWVHGFWNKLDLTYLRLSYDTYRDIPHYKWHVISLHIIANIIIYCPILFYSISHRILIPYFPYIYIYTLVGGLEHFSFFQYIWGIIIPTDTNSIIFQRGRSTTNQPFYHHSIQLNP